MGDDAMTGKQITLLAIFAYVALTLGSFIWFFVTWDPSMEQSVTEYAPILQPGDRIA